MTQHFVILFLVILFTDFKSSICTNIIEVEVLPSEKELPIGDSVTLTCSLDETYRSALGSSISWEYPPDVNMETVNIENTYFTITSMAENNIGTYTCKYIGFKDGILLKGSGSSVISIKPEQPGQPQNMAAAGFTEDSITLQWEAGFWGYADTLYYKLEYSEEESAWKPWNEDIPADLLEYEAEGLQSETSYKFRISQVSKGGQSIPSDPTSPLYLLKPGAVTVYPKIMRTEQLNSTAIRVIWQMPNEFSDIVNEWFVEYRLKEEGAVYKAVRVDRKDLSMTISTISGLEEASTYQIRMYCRNEHGRGPPSRPVTEESTAEAAPSGPPSRPVTEESTAEAAPSAPPRDVRAIFADLETRELDIRWSQPPQRDINGVLTGYQIKLYYTDPAEEGNTTNTSPSQNSQHDVSVDSRQFKVFPTSFPCWVAVAAKTGQGIGPFSDFEMVALPLEEPVNGGAMNEVIAMFKQPWVIALVGALLLILIVMISIIACRQQKIKRRKLEQQQVHTPFLKSYHSSSVNSSMNGQQYRMRDDGPQYEKIPDSRNTTPHDGLASPPPIPARNTLTPARNTLTRQSSETIDSTATCPDYSEIDKSEHGYANDNERLVSSSTLPRRDKLKDKGARDKMIHDKVGSSRSFDGRIFDNRSTPGGSSYNSRHDVNQAGAVRAGSSHGSQRSLDSRGSSLTRGVPPPDYPTLFASPQIHRNFSPGQEGGFHSNQEEGGDCPDYNEIPNSYIDNRMPPQNYCPSNLSMDSRQYSMSQNSSIDDLASTIPSVTYSIPHSRDGYKVVNPTHNDGQGREIPVAKVPPKAKEHDPNAVKPKVYGNITVKEWREQQLRKKTRGGGESDTSLLSSFGKDSGRGSTDNVSVSGSESEEGSDVEKYLEEDFSPRNSMSRSPPDSSAFLNPNRAKNQPPIAAENNHRPDDNTSIGSDMYMRCEAVADTTQPVNIYNLNGGVSEADD